MNLKHTFLILALTALTFSCEREDLTREGIGIVDGIKGDPELTTLAAAMDRTGFEAKLNGTQYTFLAPTNEAFTASGVDINQMDDATLLKLLQYHIIPSRIDSSRFDIDYGKVNSQITRSTTQAINFLGTNTYQGYQTMNLEVNANVYNSQVIEVINNANGVLQGRGVFFNGIEITEFDTFEGDDGVVHKLGKVLTPPSGNIAEIIASNPDLTLFNKLINKASANASGIPSYVTATLSVLPSGTGAPLATTRLGSLTVFAPTNSAMTAEGLTEAGINALTPAQAQTRARRHVINLRYFSPDFYNQLIRNNPAVTSVAFDSQEQLTAGPPATFFKVTYNNNGTPFFSSVGTPAANIVAKDIVTTNGVLYIIDQVIK